MPILATGRLMLLVPFRVKVPQFTSAHGRVVGQGRSQAPKWRPDAGGWAIEGQIAEARDPAADLIDR